MDISPGRASSVIPDVTVAAMVPELPPFLGARAQEMGGVCGPAPGATSVVRRKEEDGDSVCAWTATSDDARVRKNRTDLESSGTESSIFVVEGRN
jgi:hypothetical protein